MNSIELRQQLAAVWERAKQINDLSVTENRNLTTEEETNWNAANAEIVSLEARIKRQEVMERAPAAPNAPEQRHIETADTARTSPRNLRALPEYKEAFDKWLVFGRRELDQSEQRMLSGQSETLSAMEARALGINAPTGAGYLVPTEYERSILQNMLAFGGMRTVATIISTANGADLQMPFSDDTGNVGELLAEHQAISYQDASVGMNVLRAHKFGTKGIKVSLELLQDSAFSIESWLAGLMAERLARVLNTYYTLGTGTNQPNGIAMGAAAGVAGVTGQSTTVGWDDLITLEHTIDPAYRVGSRYMFNDTTLRNLRQLKDGDGNYIWQRGTVDGVIPATINGYPYTINQDVPAMAASVASIYFGRLSAYIIRDVLGLSIIRVDELFAEVGQVAFFGFSRSDGLLVHAGTNPVKKFTNSAS